MPATGSPLTDGMHLASRFVTKAPAHSGRQPAAALALSDPFEQMITDRLFSGAARDKIIAGDRPAIAKLDRDV